METTKLSPYLEAVEEFVNAREEKFPGITQKMKEEWAENIMDRIIDSLADNDTFFDSMPDSVRAIEKDE